MDRLKFWSLGIVVAGAALLTAAQLPPPFAQTEPGQWEIEGVPGAKAPLRQCIADLARLAQFEHRTKACSLKLISSSASSAVFEYSCGAAGFGRSEIGLITPRSLRIETQGISDQLPFSYVLQARRVGDCPAPATAPRH